MEQGLVMSKFLQHILKFAEMIYKLAALTSIWLLYKTIHQTQTYDIIFYFHFSSLFKTVLITKLLINSTSSCYATLGRKMKTYSKTIFLAIRQSLDYTSMNGV